MTIAWIAAELRYDFHVVYALDSFDYRALAETNLSAAAMFSARRPPAYPFLLDIARLFGSSYGALPYLQYAIFFAAIIALFRCLTLSGFRGWEALLLAAPLASATILREYGSYLLTEVPSAAAAIVSVGLAFLIASTGPGRVRNILFGASVLVACLIKPGFLFLVLLLPVAIAFIAPSVRPTAERKGVIREFAMNLTSAVVPILVYCAIRFAVIGHFGLVSYGGVALSGFGTNPALLTRDDVSSLSSPEMKALASALMNRRDSLLRNPSRTDSSFVYDAAEIARRPMLEAWPEAFDVTVWKVAVPAARTFYKTSQAGNLNPDWVLVNDRLGRLSSEIVMKEKRTYARWVVSAFRSAVQKVFHYEEGGRWAVGLAVVLLIAVTFWRGISAVTRVAVGDAGLASAAAIATVALALVLTFNAEAAVSLLRTMAAVTKGTIIGTLYPLLVLFCCFAATGLSWWGFVRGRSGTIPGRAHPTSAYGALSLLFFLAGALMVVLVETPGKRYLIALSPLLPGVVLLFTVKLLIRAVGKRQLA